jgi:tetratricopeptide (TPR) repeat protein
MSQPESRTESSAAFQHYLSGKNARLFDNDYEASNAFFDAAANTDTGFVLAWFFKAINLIEAGDIHPAQEAISQAQKLDYRLPAKDRATLERIDHSVIGSSDLYRELPTLNAELANSLVLGGDLDQAEKALAEGFRLNPSEPLLWVNKARFQFASGLPHLAQASVNYALAIWKDADMEQPVTPTFEIENHEF